MKWRATRDSLRPMLATLSKVPLHDPHLAYEPKYDGIRTLAQLEPGDGGATVHLWSRLGNDKTSQFPSLVRALQTMATAVAVPLLVDGEIVALDAEGRPAGFQRLQGRIHLTGAGDIDRSDRAQPVAFIAFDLLREGDEDLRGLPLLARRRRLEARWSKHVTSTLRLSEQAVGDGQQLHERALREGWEGLIAKAVDSPYHSGRRTPAWRKLKLLCEQEFVIGGWTEPRQTRQHLGALLLGVYDAEGTNLVYVGHTGTGFNQAELERVWKLLKAREIPKSPFSERIRTNEPAHWVRPELVAQVRFTEWTADRKLRHPVYLGLRDDKAPEAVVRERPITKPNRGVSGRADKVRLKPDATSGRSVPLQSEQTRRRGVRLEPDATRRGGVPLQPDQTRRRGVPLQPDQTRRRGVRLQPDQTARRSLPLQPEQTRRRSVRLEPDQTARRSVALQPDRTPVLDTTPVVQQLRALEDAHRDGTIELPGGGRLGVTNLSKIFWPAPKLTKGDLLRYYATVAPLILPAVADRPLVMKRFPNGVDGPAFYQQRSRQEKPPLGVRIETLPEGLDPISEPDARRLIGGSLITLLYMTQIAAISQDPWFSRVGSPLEADYVAIDLDPGDETTFARVLDVARWVRDELESLRVPGVPKTSGSRGLHIYIPLPPGTSYESGLLFCQVVATLIAARYPKIATVERKVRARGRGTVYVDYLQNILGKTLATAYSARASEFAGVSAPLTWTEVDEGVDPRDFTIMTAPQRFAEVGDLWARLRRSRPADLEAVFRKYAR